MTEPTYEINIEALESLSISDLTGLMQYYQWFPIYKEADIVSNIIKDELDKRINNIIIF